MHGLLASSAAVQGLGMAATLLVGVQLARYLGPAEYGVYGLVMAVVALATVGAQFGLTQFATREAARSISSSPPARPGAVIRWIMTKVIAISAISSVLLVLLILLTSPHWAAGRRDLIGYAGATIFLLSLFGVGIGLVRGLGRNLFGQMVESLARPVATIIALLLLYLVTGGLTVEEALIVQACVILAAIAAISAVLLRPPVPRGPAPEDYRPAGWVKTCLSFLSANALSGLNSNYPLLVAGAFVSAHDLRAFRVALSSAMLVALPSSIANIAVGPVVAKLHHDRNRDELNDTISQTTIACFAATLLGLLVFWLAGRPLISFVFGSQYLPAYGPLLILGVAQLLVSAFGIVGTFLSFTGSETVVLKAVAISVPLGILISIPMTAEFGISGAAMGNLAMVAAWLAYVMIFHRREIDAPVSIVAAVRHLSGKRSSSGGSGQ